MTFSRGLPRGTAERTRRFFDVVLTLLGLNQDLVEQPVVGLVAVGLAAVVAESFARIFYRAAINQGLLLVECPEAVKAYRDGDAVSLDPEAGRITVGGRELAFPSLPPEIMAIREAGGLLPYVRAKLRESK